MITVNQSGSQTITVSLNRSYAFDGDNVDLVFSSPSRPQITITKAITAIGSGFFTFTLLDADKTGFVDDTYSYQILKGTYTLKEGFVRLVDGLLTGFEYEIEHLFSE